MGSIPITRSKLPPDSHRDPGRLSLSGAAGELPLDIFPTLWVVQQDDFPQARELLATFLENPDSEGDPARVCPGCGGAVEPGFDLCWNCGQRRD